MKRPLIVGLAAMAGLAVAGVVTSRTLGSRPDGVGSDGPLAPCGDATNCYRTRRVVPAPPDATLDAAETALREHASWFTGQAVSVRRTPEGLRAVFKAGPFRDDVTLAAEPAPGGATLYLRSASRTGESDLGVNRRRGEAILDAVTARLR